MTLDELLPPGVTLEDTITAMAGLSAFLTVLFVWNAFLKREIGGRRLRELAQRRQSLRANDRRRDELVLGRDLDLAGGNPERRLAVEPHQALIRGASAWTERGVGQWAVILGDGRRKVRNSLVHGCRLLALLLGQQPCASIFHAPV